MLHENVILYVRLIDAMFPNYREVIPEKSPKKVVLNRSRFLESLRRASIVSVDKFRGIKLDLFDDKLTISSNNPDVGESEETIDIEYNEEKLSIAFNARYFTEVLNALDCEDVVMELDNESTPVMIKDTQDENFTAVIMPMRI
jgi:DNA polymerase-3 subunit beta